jgi:hypothetical protein
MNTIRNIILAIAIVFLSSMAFGEEPAKKPGENKDPIIGHSAQQDYLDELREKQTEKSAMWYKIFGAAACVGILSVGGLMIYFRFKSDEQ